MSARFEVFKDTHGMWRWRLIAANGEVVAQSEAYTTKRHATRGAGDAKTAAAAAEDA